MLNNSSNLRIHRFLWLGLLLIYFHHQFVCAESLSGEAIHTARIELIDQSLFFGRVVDINENVVVFENAWLGEIDIELSAIVRLESNAPMSLLMADRTTLNLDSLLMIDGKLVLNDVDNLNLKGINVFGSKVVAKRPGYLITGRVTTDFEVNRGNTQTNKFDVDIETTLESDRDRITIRSHFDEANSLVQTETLDETTGDILLTAQTQNTSDNWRITGKYDYFLNNPKNYVGVNLSYGADEFADIARRAYVGPYFGRKLVAREWLTLDAELGLSYVDTDFLVAQDEAYAGLNLNFTGESYLFDGALRLYLRQVSFINLSAVDEGLYRSTLGFSFPLLLGLEASAEISADYDGGAAEGKDNLDHTYRLRVGYSW